MAIGPRKIAAWAITSNGLSLAGQLQARWPDVAIYCSRRLSATGLPLSERSFDSLAREVAVRFNQFDGHIFFMAAGIVVRTIGTLLKHKSVDPAVVVVDDQGRFAISLVSGHIGGANRLAVQVAELLGATAVITTATDVNGRPAIDTLAVQHGLSIENHQAIKAVNMALLAGRKVAVCDLHGMFTDALGGFGRPVAVEALAAADDEQPGVCVADNTIPLPDSVLILRPPTLVAGIGCNRGTSADEIRSALMTVLNDNGLSLLSLTSIASIDLKSDEPGLLAAAQGLGVPLHFFTRVELNQIHHVPNPSHMVAKHVGVQSVCEAAAILAAQKGNLIVPKQKRNNVTVAIARRSFSSSASAPAA